MKIVTKISLLTASLVLVSTGVPALALRAPNPHANAQSQTEMQPTDPNRLDRKEIAQTKLADAKLRSCKNRERAINNILYRIADRGQRHLDLFTTIAERTEKFYANKGKTLSNYDELVSDVNNKKAAAQTAVDEIKASSVTFKCNGTDPKGAIASFRDKLKLEIKSLKAYRTSVKNLIVGVKSVQGTTESSDNQTSGGDQ